MKITSLKLENFRSWPEYHLDLTDITILIGKNGVGKTNVLESLWFLSSSRSWRTREEIELVNWGKEYTRISAKIEVENTPHDLELFFSKGSPNVKPGKQLKIDGVKKRLIEIVGGLPSVLFSPETIDLVSGAPGARRKFLDILLSQTDRHYVLDLIEYGKVTKERNKLLLRLKMKRAKPDELDFWDKKLVELGTRIIKQRLEAIKFFNKYLSETYHKIANSDEELKIKYHPSVDEDRFMDILVAGRERDIEQSATNYGPHRDDFGVYLGGRNIASFGSRGEYRSVVLSLKILELKFLEEKRGEKPILLLDDIFSELDSERRMHLAKIVQDQQTIITTTDIDHIEKSLRTKAKIVDIK
ncbi:TPA: DNA replication and repair protein RecF [Candidatus Berkelbacteria bacterium]|uniref:DNA replication and repair protein RecF n=1 Tax=Berkelbacteria bacterium GW2011_GWE1_39_12 TaxID=1618337 RepID=A0A0G4B347_9BACT|nr:MAG: replication and repair protein RecF protein [Berkelbacteria bacterium GW2011_GWE1_39_12]HBO60850.1 DNA replication and repair protein RecF [Candidatus Berkelbacteria bacterium]